MAKLIGTDIASPDLLAKITGRAKYAEDFRVDGMVFAKLLLSPMPHARVRGIDAARALAMPGVLGILTADDVPQLEAPGEACLTNEPRYEGEPILALAAISALLKEHYHVDHATIQIELGPCVDQHADEAEARVTERSGAG